MATRGQVLLLYRRLLQARSQFPQDVKRAESGQDMHTLLYSQIRNRFDQQRQVKDSKEIARLLDHGKGELTAMKLLLDNHFYEKFPATIGQDGEAPDDQAISFEIFG